MLVSSLTSKVTSIFRCIIFVYKLSTFNWRNLKYLDDENYDLESNDSRNVLSRCRLNLLDLHKLYVKLFPTFKTLCLSRFFFYFENLCFHRPKNVPWNDAREKLLVEAWVGYIWPVISLKQARWPVFLIVSSEKDIGREHLRKDWKNYQVIFFFLGITLIGQNGKILTAVNIDFSQSDYAGWLLLILSRHSLIIILFTRTFMRHQQ